MLHRDEDDDFYVGWQDHPEEGVRRAAAGATRVLLGLAVVAALVLGFGQPPLRGGVFEYGVEREFEGIVSEEPAPSLRVERPGHLAALPGQELPVVVRWLLVAPGKHGAQELVAGLDGQAVTVRGSLVYREGQTLLELAGPPRSVPAEDVRLVAGDEGAEGGSVAGAVHPDGGAPVPLGRATLVGEIVDSKCYFGVMVPGNGRSHRACAIRCLSGGVPPVFRVATEDGGELCLLLVGRDGRSLNGEILDRVAEPLAITGDIERHDDLLVLRAEPREFQPAP